MLDEVDLVRDIALALGMALAGGWVARLFRQPALLGYLLVGTAVGPHALGLMEDSGEIRTLATLGVVLLLFTLGVKFSLRELMRIRRVAIWGGILQMAMTVGLGVVVSSFLGWTSQEATLFGLVIALSSTMVVLSLLGERGELDSVHGRVTIGILLVQDIAAALFMFMVPTLGTSGNGFSMGEAGLAVLKAILFLAAVLVLGLKVTPWFIRRVARVGSRELFIVSSAALCFGGAVGANYIGLSAGLGAFAVGLVISESDFAHQVIGDLVPLRDIFSALFFVSVGMLIDVSFMAGHMSTIAVIVLTIVLGKFVICAAIARIFGYRGKTVPLVGAGMVQIGEFSFVLAELGRETGGFSEDTYLLILASAMITIILTPLVFSATSRLLQTEWVSSLMPLPDPHPNVDASKLSNHVIVCGYGRVGSNVVESLIELNIPVVVIDLNPAAISALRKRGIPCIYGDAGIYEVLSMAKPETAALVAVALSDPLSARLTVDGVHRANPQVDIVVRVHSELEVKILRGRGASELVQPEVEASIELVRHVLCRLGLSVDEVTRVIDAQRNTCPLP